MARVRLAPQGNHGSRPEERCGGRSARRRAAGLVLLVALNGLLAACTKDDDDDRARPPTVTTEPPASTPLAITRTPASFHVVYESGDTVEELWVRRPFDSRHVVRRGSEVISTRVTSFGRLETGSQVQAATTAVPPDVPAVDVNLRTVLEKGLEGELLRRGGIKTVAGRRCQVVRSALPLSAGALDKKPTRRNHVASCVDEAGIVLEELSVSDGREQGRIVATLVEEDPALDPQLFVTAGNLIPVLSGGGSVQEVRSGSRSPGDFFELSSPPEGFEHRGRYAVVPPQAEAFANPTMRNSRLAGVSDVWVRGAEVLVVEQGYSLGGAEIFPEGGDVEMGGAGKGRLVLSPRRPELQSGRKGGGFVRVYGTVSVDELERVAARLQKVPGGTLEFVDPEAQRRADARADD